MKNTPLKKISLGLLFFTVALGAASLHAGRRPNILFIYTDDQAPTAVGALGNPELKTPNIDRIFREGATLSNSFVTTPVCSPSRASLMTSRYASELGIYDWINPRSEKEHGLDPKTVVWPEVLSAAGYRNGLVGKWHLGTADRFHPTEMGFDYFMGFRSGGTSPKNPRLEKDGQTSRFEGFTADILTDHALEFIRENQSKTFCLCMHYRAPHAAWLPVREEDWAPYKDLDPLLPDPDFPNLNVARVKRMTREYYASMASVDRNVGRLLDKLDQLKLADNTLIVYTSDHGYHLGHLGLWYKGNAHWLLTKLPPRRWPHIDAKRRPNLLDQALRVPTAVRWPAKVKPGLVITETVSNLDWFPTLLAAAEVEAPQGTLLRGRSILPLLKGKSVKWENDFYCEYSMKHGALTHMRAIRTSQWKLMRDFNNPGRAELYNLEKDPREKTNLIDSDDAEAVKIKAELTQRLLQKMRDLGDVALKQAENAQR